MSQRTVLQCLRVLAILAIVSVGWTAAFAGEPARVWEPRWLQEPVVRPHLQQKNEAPLLYALPDSLPAEPPFLLKVEVLQNGRAAIRQMIEFQADLPKSSVIEVLADHPGELRHLRKREAAHPGSIRLGLWLGDQLLQELSLRELEEGARSLAPLAQPAAGITRQVEVLAGGGPGRITSKAYEEGRDPACVQHCDDERYFCYTEICDPRGSCEYCEQYYNDCVLSCPEVCVDPKRVYTFTTLTYVGSYAHGTKCFEDSNPYDFIGDLYRLWEDVFLERTYERTEYCNGSYSDRLVSQRYVSSFCYALEFRGGCFYPNSYVSGRC